MEGLIWRRWFPLLLALALTAAAAPLATAEDPREAFRAQPHPYRTSTIVAVAAERDLGADFEVAGGLAVTLWAESPMLFNPTAIDVDHRGRLWVTEGVNYRRWGGRNPGLEHPAGDRVVILEDADGDGIAESSKVFVEDADLVSPLGICVVGNQVLVSCSPSVFLYTDTDGDDRPDKKEVFLTGFGGHDHDHGLHSLVVGPDGRYWFTAGNAGPHLVTDAAGWHLRSGSTYSDGGATLAPNRPGLRSDDGRVWVGGLMLRVGRDGRGLTVLGHNFRNPYELAVDSFGDLWTSDNDDDGNQACRTTWVMPGGNYGFFSSDGERSWPADRRPEQSAVTAHWRQEDPGVAPTVDITGAGAPVGICFYEGDLLGDSLRGALLGGDAGRSLVWVHRPRPAGAGFTTERSILIQPRAAKDGEEDRSRWFRPSDVAVGTDGAVYVADWFDPVVGGHAARDRQAYGRILRIAPRERPAPRPCYQLDSVDHLVWALAGPAVNVRGMAWHELRKHGAAAAGGVLELMEGSSDHRLQARALWWLAAGRTPDVATLVGYLASPAENLRVTALRASAALEPELSLWSMFRKMASDSSPAVRREIALMLARGARLGAYELLVELARGYDGHDPFALEALALAAGGDEEAVFARLLAALGDQPLAWSPAFARLAGRLHPATAVPAFQARAMAGALSPEQRREAVTALGFIPDRAAGEAMLTLAQGGREDVRGLASWWVTHNHLTLWREYGLAAELGGDRASAELRAESGAMKSGSKQLVADVRGARTLWLEVGDAGDGDGHDWADWLEPRLLAPDGAELRLTELPWTSARSGWGTVNRGKNTGGGALAAGGATFTDGIGTHATSEIVYRLPAGHSYTELRVTVALDDGGTGQPGSRSSVEFKVFADVASSGDDRQAVLQRQLLDASRPLAERALVAAELARTAVGGQLLLGLVGRGELPADVHAAVALVIFTCPEPAVRALATRYFQRPGQLAGALPSLPEIAGRPGDRKRGQELFLSERGTCVTCHVFQGRGAAIGPDLTAIGDKYNRLGVLDALVDPGAGIPFGYEAHTVMTTGGEALLGFILADGESVVLKDLSGARRVIARDDIASHGRLPTSLMPSATSLGLSADDLADLCAFLLAGRELPGRIEEPVALFDGESLAGWTHHPADGSGAAQVWSAGGGVLSCRGTPAGYLRTEADYLDFQLTLEWRFPPGSPGGNSGVLLRMVGPDQVWPKSIEAQLQSGSAGDIWNIGEFPMFTSPARTDGRHTGKLAASSEQPLGEWNRYTITLDRGDLTLEVCGTVQNTASYCAELPGKICLQSEGVPIEFRNIVLRPILHNRDR